MRIKEIEINNFKAFYGNYKIDLGRKGKNLLLYGENGSGKSSLFIALKEFFNSSQNDVDLTKYDNIFLSDSEKENNYIKLKLWDQSSPYSRDEFELSKTNNNTNGTYIADTNKVKAFLDYKKVLRTHFSTGNNVNIFDLAVFDILNEAINPITNNFFGEDWNFINENIVKHHFSNDAYYAKERIKKFNEGLKTTLEEIKPTVNEILNYFSYNLELSFNYNGISDYYKEIKGKELFLNVAYYENAVDSHHFFLNEARLTAIAISIYLATILNYPQETLKHKILFLDDVLIGLDSSNRLPLLDIIKNHFSNYQIFIGTYDLQWFSLAKQYLGESEWKFIKLFVGKLDGHNFEIPVIKDDNSYIETAENYLSQHDYKAASVYIRTAFEEILKKYCNKYNKKVKYKIDATKLQSNDFWESIKDEVEISLKTKIETYRSIVMNPFSHDDLTKPQYKIDLENTIDAVKQLKTELNI